MLHFYEFYFTFSAYRAETVKQTQGDDPISCCYSARKQDKLRVPGVSLSTTVLQTRLKRGASVSLKAQL